MREQLETRLILSNYVTSVRATDHYEKEFGFLLWHFL